MLTLRVAWTATFLPIQTQFGTVGEPSEKRYRVGRKRIFSRTRSR
jgi:hypothetical protein